MFYICLIWKETNGFVKIFRSCQPKFLTESSMEIMPPAESSSHFIYIIWNRNEHINIKNVNIQ